ncbi:hypothetical protein TNCV_4046321 [Trichonephila clavipes]|nr:hypothetical protein TNCV_4046321 [Trichonephila clavipes]
MRYCNLPKDTSFLSYAWSKTSVSPFLKAAMLKAQLLPLRPQITFVHPSLEKEHSCDQYPLLGPLAHVDHELFE